MPSFVAAISAILRASACPCLPTEVLAHPELTIIAWACLFARCCCDSTTGGDLALLLVKTPAAVHGAREYKMPRSRLPLSFIPAQVAPARNPLTVVTVP